MKSMLWECRRVFHWSWAVKNGKYHDKYYRNLDGLVDKNYLRLHTVDKVPFDLSKPKAHYEFVCPIYSISLKPIRISTKMLKNMHAMKLQLRDQTSGRGLVMMPCLEYGKSNIFIYISRAALDKVGLKGASKFSGNNKKRKKAEKTQGSQKQIKETLPRSKKFKNRTRRIDDIVPHEVYVPAMVLPFKKPTESLSSKCEINYILEATYKVVYKNCTDPENHHPYNKRELSEYFLETWAGWYRDYTKAGPWPYVLWKNDDYIPHPIHAKPVEFIVGPTGSQVFLGRLQKNTKNFQSTAFCKAVKEAGFNVDFEMMKKFGLTKSVRRGENTWVAPIFTSKALVAGVMIHASNKIEIEIDENSKESSPDMDPDAVIHSSWGEIFNGVSLSSSTTATTVSKKRTRSHFEEPEKEEENIKLVDALPSNNNIVSRQTSAGHSRDSAQLWNISWTLGGGVCTTLDSIPLPDQLKCLNTGQTIGENLFNHHKTHIQKLEDELHDAKAELKQVDCGLLRIGQEKKCYMERKLKKSKKCKEYFKKCFGEHVDAVDDESILSVGAEGQGEFWLGRHFPNFVAFFSTPLSPQSQQPQVPVLVRPLVVVSDQSVLAKGTHIFLSEIPSPSLTAQAIGTLSSNNSDDDDNIYSGSSDESSSSLDTDDEHDEDYMED